MGRHRTPDEKLVLGEQARALRAAGRSRRGIRAELAVGDDLLTELLAGTEVPHSLRRPRGKDDARDIARAMYAEGRSYREIERELGVARSSLSLWLRDLKGRDCKDASDATDSVATLQVADSRRDLARELRRDGLLLREIAEQLGVSHVTIHRWVRDLPVPHSARPGG